MYFQNHQYNKDLIYCKTRILMLLYNTYACLLQTVASYWPEGSSAGYGPFQVEVDEVDDESFEHMTVRQISLKHKKVCTKTFPKYLCMLMSDWTGFGKLLKYLHNSSTGPFVFTFPQSLGVCTYVRVTQNLGHDVSL